MAAAKEPQHFVAFAFRVALIRCFSNPPAAVQRRHLVVTTDGDAMLGAGQGNSDDMASYMPR